MVDSVKQVTPIVGVPHPTGWTKSLTLTQIREGLQTGTLVFSCLWTWTEILALPRSWACKTSYSNHTIGSPGSLALDLAESQNPGRVSQEYLVSLRAGDQGMTGRGLDLDSEEPCSKLCRGTCCLSRLGSCYPVSLRWTSALLSVKWA